VVQGDQKIAARYPVAVLDAAIHDVLSATANLGRMQSAISALPVLNHFMKGGGASEEFCRRAARQVREGGGLHPACVCWAGQVSFRAAL
jgi:hypothetical protein